MHTRSENPAGSPTGQEYWRSLDHLAETDEFREFMFREFPAGATDLLASDDRRHFLKIMGASMALAGLGLAGCRRWPDEKIVPFASRAPGRDPGVAVRYATSREMNGVSSGLLVTAFDGRPTKIEGNPEHPVSRGAADMFDQASVLDLYDPDRSRTVFHDGAESDWAAFDAWAADRFEKLHGERGNGLAVLCEASGGPSMDAMRERFITRYPMATWHTWEPIANDNEVDGSTMAFGAPHRTVPDLARADVIVTLDADVLAGNRNAVGNIRGFATGRRVTAEHPDMSRLYAAEPDLTLTGANADERVAVRRSAIPMAAAYLAGKLMSDAALLSASEALSADAKALLDHAADDLAAHRGHGLVVAGAAQPAAVHFLVHAINDVLGNAGETVRYLPQPDGVGHAASLAELLQKMDKGWIETLVIIGGNPVYDAPGFAEALAKAPESIHLGDHRDETGMQCAWHLNRAHFLEAWGDGRAWDGTPTLGQPLIEPLFGGRSALEVLALITADEADAGHDIVRRTFAAVALGRDVPDGDLKGADEKAWRKALHDGFYAGGAAPSAARVDRTRTAAAAAAIGAPHAGHEVVFTPNPTLWDGRFANNGWLQEAPDPLTKLTWDNAAIIAPAMAEELGIGDGDMLAIQVDGRTLDVPALRLPGVEPHTIVLALGGGRAMNGRICTGAGFDTYRLRTAGALWGAAAEVDTGRGSYTLATTQDHHAIDAETVGGRGIQERLPTLFREADLNEFREHPDFAKHRTHVVHRLNMWSEENLDGSYAWGMTIDLNSCVGCSACMVACQAENNIPIVGKDQVKRGREMHWIRIDRYFRFGRTETDSSFDTSNVRSVAMQPVMCMMCENAPCEQVCPVAATVHDQDGLNVMVYNRCIGTRYCSNNCPYKVRRFNYFDYWRREPHRERGYAFTEPDYFTKRSATPDELRQLQFNPEVTVRMRGVMEKCTYCIQRISDARIKTKNEFARSGGSDDPAAADRVPIPDGTITPACAQTCPGEAITFGDLRDPRSSVSRTQKDGRAYQMLEELNVRARTQYLAKVRNPVGGGSAGDHGGGHGGGQDDGHGTDADGHAEDGHA